MGGKLNFQQTVDQSADQMDVTLEVPIWKNYYKVFEKKSGRAFRKTTRNSSFPGSSFPVSQNESSCKTFHMKMSLICMKMDV